MLEEGIFDIHCHIVPGVDDGAADIEETRKLLEMEYKQGVRNIILTPHFRFRMFETPLEKVQRQFFLNLKNMDAERISCAHENKKPSFTYRKYAFMAQQYINTVLALKRIPRIAKRIILESGEAAYKLEL